MVLGSVLLIALVPIVLVVIAYFISRAVFRIVMAISTALFVIALIIGGFVMFDAYRFTGDLERGPTRFVLENDTIAVETRNGTMHELNASELEGSNARVTFVVRERFLSENATAGFEAANVSKDAALAAMRSQDPYATYSSALAESYARSPSDEAELRDHYDETLRERYEDETAMRSYVFGQLLSSTIDERGSDAIVHGIRSDDILVEPKRPIISFIEQMPERLIENALDVEVQ